jgi:carbonic anhydrase
MCDDVDRAISRRSWLRQTSAAAGAALLLPACAPVTAGTGGAAGGATPASGAAGSAATAGATAEAGAAGAAGGLGANVSPDVALQRLVAGNRRFAQGTASNPNRTLARLQELGTTQQPFAAILGCSDSRVPLEILFDAGFGDIFVARVAGNVVTSELMGSLEYGTQLLGAQLVMVLGHTACGAVTATMKAGAVPGQIGSLYPHMHAAVVAAEARGIEAVIEQNVRNQVSILQRASPVLAELTRAGRLRIVGGVFDFHTGLVRML